MPLTSEIVFALTAVIVFCLGLYGLIAYAHLVRKIMAINVMGSAVFLFFGAIARRNFEEGSDPVPQAMVITGIVVAVAATAFALTLARRLHAETGQTQLPEEQSRR